MRKKLALRADPLGRLFIMWGMAWAAAPTALWAQERPTSPWPDAYRMSGSVFVGGGGELAEDVEQRFVALAGGAEARIVVIPISSSRSNDAAQTASRDRWSRHGVASVESGEVPTAETSGVWLDSGEETDLIEGLHRTGLEEQLAALIARGGAVGANGRGAAAMTALSIVGGDHHARVGRGLDVVPGAVVLTGFSSDETASLRLLSALTSNPGRVGIGIDAGTAIAIDGASRTLPGRGIQVLGEGDVTLLLAANEFKPVRRQVYRARRGEMSVASEEDRAQTGQRRGARAGQRRGGRQGRGETRGARGGGGGRIIADLGAWRRDAIERTLPEPFPAPEPVTPFVENGTLFIVGGGGSPTDLYRKMVEKAGGDAAKFVYIPCSEAADVGDQSRTANNFVRNGAAEATWIHTKDRVKANTDEAILGPLREATGLWFGGGRQWNFVDSYHGTTAMELMQDVLARGGVVGGSSAGASIQGEWLARADPLGNADILAPGYERGLGFIEGVAIDQHFRQRNRFLNMTGLMKEYPQLLGIGLDEATAIVVEKSIAEVIGRNEVQFYDFWNRPPRDGEKDHVSLGVGGRYDMAARKVLAWGSGRSMLAGSWHLIVDSPHGAMPATMRVVEDDLSGAFTFESKEYALADLNISEGRVRFGVTLDMQGEAIVLAFEGELNERELTGRLTGEFHGEAQAMNVKGAKEEGGSECEDS